MAQTVNGQENGTPQKQYRPGQRQQERMRFDDALGHRLADPPRAQDHILIDQGRDDGTDDRPNAVDEIVLPEAASQCWAEGACGIQRCTRQWSAHENSHE